VVAGLLRSSGATVATAESLTGGLLGAELTKAAGASDVYAGGVVAYASAVKHALLGVPESLPVISAECAAAMASGVRERLGATYGVSLTGVAGPGEQEGRPVGTVYAGLAGPGGVETRELRLPGDRPRVRTFAVVAALNMLRLHLLEL
jgi:nicotinamide-nucleotide amidase